MQRQLIQPVLFLFSLTLLFSGCSPEPDFDDTPRIEFLGISPFKKLPATGGVGGQERDSLVISISYTDGDGDLGDNSPRNKADSIDYFSKYKDWGNYQIKVLRLVNGQYVELPFTENKVVVFPRLTREGSKPGAIEGTLDYRQVFYYSRNSKITPVKFQIKIRDRNLRESNMIETDTVHVPLLVQ